MTDGREDEGESREANAGNTPQDEPSALDELRARISEVDDELIRLIGERRRLVIAIGEEKARRGLPVMDPEREARVVRKAAARARELGVDQEMTRDVIWRIIAAARADQENRPLGWPEAPDPT
jgi:chorismate mutase